MYLRIYYEVTVHVLYLSTLGNSFKISESKYVALVCISMHILIKMIRVYVGNGIIVKQCTYFGLQFACT